MALPEKVVWGHGKQQGHVDGCSRIMARHETCSPTAKGSSGSHGTAVWAVHSVKAARPSLPCQDLVVEPRLPAALRERQDLCIHCLK